MAKKWGISRARGVQTPIIAVTAHALPDDRDRCLGCGMNEFLSKPITLGNSDPISFLRAAKRTTMFAFDIALVGDLNRKYRTYCRDCGHLKLLKLDQQRDLVCGFAASQSYGLMAIIFSSQNFLQPPHSHLLDCDITIFVGNKRHNSPVLEKNLRIIWQTIFACGQGLPCFPAADGVTGFPKTPA